MKYKGAYKILSSVLFKGAYLNIEMKKLDEPRAFNTRLIYGVLEKNITLDYLLDRACEKKPKPPIALLIKMGFYMLWQMDEPAHAVINGVVETAKSVGKGGTAGFINAVLRAFKNPKLPNGDNTKSLSIRYSYPEFLIKRLISDYGREDALKVISSNKASITHIRHNGLATTKEAFSALIRGITSDFSESLYGYYVTHSTLDRLNSGNYANKFTVQQLGSMLICNAFTNVKGMRVLDMCAAPGGKSIYLNELFSARVTACDVHAHRLDLIRFYAKRMGASVDILQKDGTAFHQPFAESFDAVLADVPCSGFGVARSKPDVFLCRGEEEIKELAKLQLKILCNAARYVRVGGELVYSTCTYLNEENIDVVNKFLSQHNGFVLSPISLPISPAREFKNTYQYLPFSPELEGFFIAKLVRKA